jgi:hypothetical protein
LQHSVIAPLFDYLKQAKTPNLKTLDEWKDIEKRHKPLWSHNDKAEKCGLGTAELILRHPQPQIGEFFRQFRLRCDDIREAIMEVLPRRNPVAHGGSLDIGTTEAIRIRWLRWGGRPGGIFAVLFMTE